MIQIIEFNLYQWTLWLQWIGRKQMNITNIWHNKYTNVTNITLITSQAWTNALETPFDIVFNQHESQRIKPTNKITLLFNTHAMIIHFWTTWANDPQIRSNVRARPLCAHFPCSNANGAGQTICEHNWQICISQFTQRGLSELEKYHITDVVVVSWDVSRTCGSWHSNETASTWLQSRTWPICCGILDDLLKRIISIIVHCIDS